MATFGQRLQELREKAGLSQSQLAEASGVPVWSLRGYEQGRRDPLWDVVFKLAAALGTDCRVFADCQRVTAETEAASAPAPSPAKRGRPPVHTELTPAAEQPAKKAAEPAKRRKRKAD